MLQLYKTKEKKSYSLIENKKISFLLEESMRKVNLKKLLYYLKTMCLYPIQHSFINCNIYLINASLDTRVS